MGTPISPEQIDRFITLFGGDGAAAQRAIGERLKSRTESIQKRQPVAQPTGPVLISVRDLKKTYKIGRQKLDVLHGVSFDVHEGEFIALTGASGSGKSTLLQLIGALDQPTAGTVTISGADVTKMSSRKVSEFRNKTIGFVFQFFYLQPFLRLAVNLEVPGMFARMKRAGRRARAAELAAQVGLSDRLNHFPKELSGGQMQRAAIARALFNNPKVILADEPTGNLDSVNGRAIIDLFENIRKQFGTTIIVVTHDAAIAGRADREIRLRDGVIV